MTQDVKLLIPDSGKITAINAAKKLVHQPALIPLFIELAFSNINQFSMRAANVIEHCDNENPELIKPFLYKIITSLPSVKISGVKRGFLKLCSDKDFSKDEELHSILLNSCFDWLNSNNEEIAVRYYCVKILYNISIYIPDIKPELIASIDLIMPEGSAGLKSVGKEYLKKLKKK